MSTAYLCLLLCVSSGPAAAQAPQPSQQHELQVISPPAVIGPVMGQSVLEVRPCVPNAFDVLIPPDWIRPGIPQGQDDWAELSTLRCPPRRALLPRTPSLMSGTSTESSSRTPERKREPQKKPDPPRDQEQDATLPRKGHTPFVLNAVFKDPAHFPIVSYNSQGPQGESDAAILYEGMTVGVTKDGYYELRGMIEAPRVPVTIRLQLTLFRGPTSLGTITLPPFTLDPQNSSMVNDMTDLSPIIPTKSWRLQHVGYSHLLLGTSNQTAGEFSIIRTGTARFGSLPE